MTNIFDENNPLPFIINSAQIRPDLRGHFLPLKALNNSVQINVSKSYPGVIRGMHWQSENPQSKLLTCLDGEIHDVCLDIRRSSPTFLEIFDFYLSGSTGEQLYIPRGFAHGFEVIGDEPAIVMYDINAEYDPKNECGIRWNSIGENIWRTPEESSIVSNKDLNWPTLRDYKKDSELLGKFFV